MSNDLVTINNKELALLHGDGIVLIDAVMVRLAPILHEATLCAEDSQRCEKLFQTTSMGDDNRYLDYQKAKRELLMPRTRAVVTACQDLQELYYSSEGIDGALAVKILSVLYGAMVKVKNSDDNLPTLLREAAARFDPTRDAVGVALNMWEPVPRHPVVVILGAEELKANKVFSPAASEVAEAARKAYKKLGHRLKNMLRWVERLIEADLRLFHDERDEWRKAYQDVDSIKAAMDLIDLWQHSVKLSDEAIAELQKVGLILYRMQCKMEDPETWRNMCGGEDINPAYSDVLLDDDEPEPPPKLQKPVMPVLPWKVKKQMLKELAKARRANEEPTGEEEDQ